MRVDGVKFFEVATETPQKSLNNVGYTDKGAGVEWLFDPGVKNEAENLASEFGCGGQNRIWVKTVTSVPLKLPDAVHPRGSWVPKTLSQDLVVTMRVAKIGS